MDIADSEAFTRRLIALGELFEANLTPVKQALYFEALRDLPFAVVATALNQATKVCTFMPKPAEIRKLAVGDDEDTAELAWQDYKRIAKQAGGYQSPVFEDPALADALVAVFGSWEAACWSDFSPEMWSSKRKEFGRVYRAMRTRGEMAAKQLPGFIDRENTLRGHARPELSAGADRPALPAKDDTGLSRFTLALVKKGIPE